MKKNWMVCNFLQLNTDQTKVEIIGQGSNKSQVESVLK